MTRLKTEDKEKLQDDHQAGQELHTEGPVSEKDEVKKAEDRTNGRKPHGITSADKLKDDEGSPVKGTNES